jgi:hypothetical protein
MVIFITLLAGFVPLLQVTFFALLEDLSIGLTRCERSGQNSRIIGVILICNSTCCVCWDLMSIGTMLS